MVHIRKQDVLSPEYVLKQPENAQAPSEAQATICQRSAVSCTDSGKHTDGSA